MVAPGATLVSITDRAVLLRAFVLWAVGVVLIASSYFFLVRDEPETVIAAFTTAHQQALSQGEQLLSAQMAPQPALSATAQESSELSVWRQHVLDLGKTEHLDVWLVTLAGEWLVAPTPQDERGSMSSGKVPLSFQQRFPRCCGSASEAIRADTWLADSGGLVSVRTLKTAVSMSALPPEQSLAIVAHTSRVTLELAVAQAVTQLRSRFILLVPPLALLSLGLAVWSQTRKGRKFRR